MAQTKPEQGKAPSRFAGVGSTLFGGLGLGWIMGMSVAPVTQTVIAAAIALAVAVVNALVGLQKEEQEPPANAKPAAEAKNPVEADAQPKPLTRRVSPLPFGSLLLGLALGSAAGIWTRTHDLLAPDLNARIEEWKVTSYADSLIARRMFDRTYPPLTKDNAVPKGEPATGGGHMYNVSADDCEILQRAALDSVQLRGHLQQISDENARRIVPQCNSIECMRALVNLLCAGSPQ